MSKAERDRRWRLNNPEKVKAQQARYRARKKALRAPKPTVTAEERAARKKAKAAEYNQRYHARPDVKAKSREKSRKLWELRKNDPDYREKQRERKRIEYRLKHGIPLDAPLFNGQRKFSTDEERKAAELAARRKRAAIKRGTTIEEVEARKAALSEKKRLSGEPAVGAQRRAEAKAAAVRAQRRATPAVTRPATKPAPAPVNSNDPPELAALFRKASKGEPPRPYNPQGRKRSVFDFRGG